MKTVSVTIMMGAFSQAQAVAYGEHDVHASGTLENYGHTPSGTLAVCEGDCDNDNKCKGHLKCFQRSNGEKVPGCAEAANSPKNYDFCYDPLVAKDTNVGTLTTIIDNSRRSWNSQKATQGKLEVCEGDCDGDHHCTGDYKCMQRDSNEPVPGCAASSNAVSGWDYCYDPTQVVQTVLAEDAPQKSVLSTLGPGANPDKAAKNKLNVCEGDCDNDTQCMGNLKCFQRQNGEKVPGCAEGSNSPKHYDYCYNPAKAKNEHLGTLTSIVDTIRAHYNSQKADQGKLEVCEGDCDGDHHCTGDLKCMQRVSNEPVPGCAASSNAVRGWDYCYNPMATYMPNVVKEDHDEQSCTNNCKDWTCATWCRCFNDADVSAYAADGCEDSGESECECTEEKTEICPDTEAGSCTKVTEYNGPHQPTVCTGGKYIIQHTTISDRRPEENTQQYVCTGSGSGGWGLHQSHFHDCRATSPETATEAHMWTSNGHTYGCKFDCKKITCEAGQVSE